MKCFLLNKLSQYSSFCAFQHQRPDDWASEWNQLCWSSWTAGQGLGIPPPKYSSIHTGFAAETRVSASKKPPAKHPDTRLETCRVQIPKAGPWTLFLPENILVISLNMKQGHEGTPGAQLGICAQRSDEGENDVNCVFMAFRPSGSQPNWTPEWRPGQRSSPSSK